MPALFLFHRKTMLAGDDLQPAVCVTLALRGFQLVGLLVPIFHHIAQESRAVGGFERFLLYDPSDDGTCRHSHYFCLLLVTYAVTSTLFVACASLLEWRIDYWSSQGTPTQTEPRTSKVAHLLEYKLIPFSIVLFIVWLSGASALIFAPSYYACLESTQNSENQDDADDASIDASSSSEYLAVAGVQLWWFALGLLLLSQLFEVLFSWVFLFHLCQQPKQVRRANSSSWHDPEMEFTLTTQHELVEEMWATRCHSACKCMSVASCFLFGGRELTGQAEFGDVARALADYLETRGVLDVVPSDIVTGLVVLQQLQKQRLYEARQAVLDQDSNQVQSIEEGNVVAEGESCSAGSSSNANSLHDDRSGLLGTAMNNGPTYTLSSSRSRGQALPPSAPSSSRRSVYRFEADGTYQRQRRLLLDRRSFADMYSLEEGARYAKYALCIYTWVLYLYVHPISGPPRLLAKSGCKCCGCCGTQQQSLEDDGDSMSDAAASLRSSALPVDENGRILGDNMCEAHKTAMLLTAGLQEADLVYAQLLNGFNETPYCILLDHQWRSVVVAIRGTFSLEDCVTDVLIEPESVEQLGVEFGFDATGQYCHGGVLTCVRNVYRDLMRHGLLDRLLCGNDALYPEYTLRLTGHSLGAATCTLLSYMLRTKFPTLRCVNFGPPGATFTWQLAVGCKDWVNSFVLDSDLVPRLTLDSMDRLRDEMLELLGRIKVPKIEIARRAVGRSGLFGCNICWDTLPGESLRMYDTDEILHRRDQVPVSDYQQQLERFQVIQQERREARGVARSAKLFPPGKMVHLVKTGEKRTCVHGVVKCLTCCTTSFGSEYLPVWIANDDLNEICVSPTMGPDHFPNRYNAVMVEVANRFGLETL